MNFSIITSVYKNDTPQFVSTAFNSIINQTLPPSEIVLVIDGNISDELNKLITNFNIDYPNLFTIIRLPQNKGLGNALNIATSAAKYDIIARMDSDDIANPTRFEKQIRQFELDPELSILGGTISEFIDDPKNIIGYRVCPCKDNEIKNDMRSRCALNHVTVMFRKSDVIKAGNYLDWFWNEDYYLWIRMILINCKFANLSDVLVNVRSGKDMYARRGGIKYFKSEASLQKYMLQNKLINKKEFFINVIKRLIVQVILPNNIRGWVFKKFARKQKPFQTLSTF